jgi:hypothetical protein
MEKPYQFADLANGVISSFDAQCAATRSQRISLCSSRSRQRDMQMLREVKGSDCACGGRPIRQ